MTRDEVKTILWNAFKNSHSGENVTVGDIWAGVEPIMALYDILTAQKTPQPDIMDQRRPQPGILSVETDRNYWKQAEAIQKSRAESAEKACEVWTARARAAEEANKVHGDGLTRQLAAATARAQRAEAERDKHAAQESIWRDQAEQRGKEASDLRRLAEFNWRRAAGAIKQAQVNRERADKAEEDRNHWHDKANEENSRAEEAEDDRDCWRRKAENLEGFIVKGDRAVGVPPRPPLPVESDPKLWIEVQRHVELLKEEREACAKIADAFREQHPGGTDDWSFGRNHACEEIARAIRARK